VGIELKAALKARKLLTRKTLKTPDSPTEVHAGYTGLIKFFVDTITARVVTICERVLSSELGTSMVLKIPWEYEKPG
jgi:hypothetical protein